jgi:hypothetical protein
MATLKRGGVPISTQDRSDLRSQLGIESMQTEVTQLNGGGITAIVRLTQAAYDALPTKVATTLYVIVG